MEKSKAKTFKDVTVWKKSHDLALEIYKITKHYPVEEKFGIVSQLRRAAVSIPTNITEGFKRRSNKDFAHFVNIAEGSLEEIKYILLLSEELSYLTVQKRGELDTICDEVGRMLHGLYKKLNT